LFFNVAHIGLGARLKANLSGELKAKWGSLSYPRALLRTFAERRPFAAVIESDGQSRKVRSIEIAIGNGRYFGGGATVYHPAEIDDGRLHVFSFAPVSLWRLLKATLPLRHGWVLDPDAVCIVETRQLHIRTHRPMQVAADGELITRTPVEFRVLPQALSVFTPKRNAP
jgi:diacylglycerol kinase family enzyme